MMSRITIASPPNSGWGMEGVTANGQSAGSFLGQIVGYIAWFGFVVSGLALIALAAMMALDKNRGRSISATAPHTELVKISLGILIISGAGALASTFFNLV